jgi:hypothetical protein
LQLPGDRAIGDGGGFASVDGVSRDVCVWFRTRAAYIEEKAGDGGGAMTTGESVMFWITIILLYAMGFVSGTYLAVSDHPWFAFLAFIITGSISMKHNDDKKVDNDPNP